MSSYQGRENLSYPKAPLEHNTVAVHLFQRKLLDFLTEHCAGKKPDQVYYMSYGCAAQYETAKTLLICAFMVRTLVSLLNGTSLQPCMGSLKEMVQEVP